MPKNVNSMPWADKRSCFGDKHVEEYAVEFDVEFRNWAAEFIVKMGNAKELLKRRELDYFIGLELEGG